MKIDLHEKVHCGSELWKLHSVDYLNWLGPVPIKLVPVSIYSTLEYEHSYWFFCLSPSYTLSFSWFFSRSFLRRLDWSQVGSTTDQLTAAIQHTKDLNAMRAGPAY